MNYLKIGIEFVITFLVLYLIYYFFIIRKCKKKSNFVPTEVNLILTIYRIDYRKINLYQMTKLVCLVSTLVMALIITLISAFFDNTIIVIIFGTLLSVVIAIIFYNMIGRYFKKQSMKK